jgi:hypothetical protein
MEDIDEFDCSFCGGTLSDGECTGSECNSNHDVDDATWGNCHRCDSYTMVFDCPFDEGMCNSDMRQCCAGCRPECGMDL